MSPVPWDSHDGCVRVGIRAHSARVLCPSPSSILGRPQGSLAIRLQSGTSLLLLWYGAVDRRRVSQTLGRPRAQQQLREQHTFHPAWNPHTPLQHACRADQSQEIEAPHQVKMERVTTQLCCCAMAALPRETVYVSCLLCWLWEIPCILVTCPGTSSVKFDRLSCTRSSLLAEWSSGEARLIHSSIHMATCMQT
jgi:hypothetical protein